MITRAFWEFLLFLLPFALYFLYTRVARRDDDGKLGHAHPWAWLFIAGLVLAIAGLVWVGLTDSKNEGVYVPAHTENGKVVPGHYEPAPAP
jgi:Family of unknown function (DUF6111)